MFKWENKSFPIFLISQYQFQYQLPGQLVSTRIWIRPVLEVNKTVKHLWVLKFHKNNAFLAIALNGIIFEKFQPISV